MTHAEAIDIVRTLATAGATRPDPAVCEAATVHVARCSDCWATVAGLHEAATGAAPEAQPSFGCEAVRDRLYLLVDLDVGAIARAHAPLARHLGWCLACRSRLAEMIAVERDVAATPRWIELAERTIEAAGRLVVRIGRRAASLVEIPDAFLPGPAVVPLAVRGERDEPAPIVQSTRVELAPGVWAEVGVDTADGERVGLSLRLSTAHAGPLTVNLREQRADDAALVGRYTLRGTEPVLVRDMWPGSFVLELHDPRDTRTYRVRLDIGPGA